MQTDWNIQATSNFSLLAATRSGRQNSINYPKLLIVNRRPWDTEQNRRRSGHHRHNLSEWSYGTHAGNIRRACVWLGKKIPRKTEDAHTWVLVHVSTQAGRQASTHARTHARMHARTHVRTHACARLRTAEPSIIVGLASAAIFLAALDSHEVAKGLLIEGDRRVGAKRGTNPVRGRTCADTCTSENTYSHPPPPPPPFRRSLAFPLNPRAAAVYACKRRLWIIYYVLYHAAYMWLSVAI